MIIVVGSDRDCVAGSRGMAVVHACKTCHQKAIGYRGSLSKDHPNYLWLESGYDLYLNIIDPPVPLFYPETFEKFLEFGLKHYPERKVLIHCNQGESRAPSLAMLLSAKLGLINGESYDKAKAEFPPFFPGKGITEYLRQNWNKILRGGN